MSKIISGLLRFFGSLVSILFVLFIVLVIAVIVNCQSLKPDFTATAARLPTGEHIIEISLPDSIRSIGHATVSDHTGVLATWDNPGGHRSPKLFLPSTYPAGTQVQVSCELQYDNPIPSIGTLTRQITLK